MCEIYRVLFTWKAWRFWLAVALIVLAVFTPLGDYSF